MLNKKEFHKIRSIIAKSEHEEYDINQSLRIWKNPQEEEDDDSE